MPRKTNSRKHEISVVVCVKNEEKNIEACLRCLKNQEVLPEIIIVDGHSKDNTIKISKKYTNRVFFDHGQGLSDARNVGFRAAKSTIVAYCDADCMPEKNWTKNILRCFEDRNVIAVSGPLISYDGGFKMKLNMRIWANWFPRTAALFFYNNVWGANMAFRKNILEKNPFRLKFLEDYDMGHRLRRIGKVRFSKSVSMPVSSRRFEKGFVRTCMNFYIKTFIMMKLFGRYDSAGYYNEKGK